MIKLDQISKSYRGNNALLSTTKEFASGKTSVLIGPSGCGKSTLLRIIVGLVTPDSGTVTVDGALATPENLLIIRQKIGYMIQEGGLFPHLTAAENASLLADYLKKPASETKSRIDELCALTQLPASALEKFPSELSGGQRQRVALIRALMLDPPTLLLDEPLGALDPITRYELQRDLKEIFARLHKTVVMVTHDLSEAAFLGDDISLMREGHIVQSGTLETLSKSPSEPYVTEFLNAQRGPAVVP